MGPCPRGAGAHVIYGLMGLKTHAKTTLIVRQDGNDVRRYCHVGTGNYNPKTARMYEDLGVLSSRAELGADVTRFFNYIAGFSQPPHYQQLVTSPGGIRDFVIECIGEEAKAGSDGRVIIKVNGLDDPAVIDALYEASAAGVSIDLVIRGICCLRPGVPGLSETIRVRSIVGRFLEHSRIFRFGGSAERPARFYIGSADLRRRNLDRRVEAMIPVDDPDAVRQLGVILDTIWLMTRKPGRCMPDGNWDRVPEIEGIATQEVLAAQALERSVPPDDSRSPRSAAHKSVAGWGRRRRPRDRLTGYAVMASMRATTSSVSLGSTSMATRFSVTCSTRLAPVMTEDT